MNTITIDMTKAKEIGHEIRRALRSTEFEPFDEIISKQIPGHDFAAIEADRQAVRDKYATMQIQINAANTPEQIKSVLGI